MTYKFINEDTCDMIIEDDLNIQIDLEQLMFELDRHQSLTVETLQNMK